MGQVNPKILVNCTVTNGNRQISCSAILQHTPYVCV